jgi:hypothetical protein
MTEQNEVLLYFSDGSIGKYAVGDYSGVVEIDVYGETGEVVITYKDCMKCYKGIPYCFKTKRK